MSDSTGIAWTDVTWNPVTGCSKVSPGCAHCYAEKMALTRLAGKPGYVGLPWTPENAAANVVLRPDRLAAPLRWRKPKRVFVNSMSDLFHEQVPDEFVARVWNVMACATPTCAPHPGREHEEECWQGEPHTFQVLTKRPERMAAFLADDWDSGLNRAMEYWPGDMPLSVMREAGEWPLPNVWLGTSVENQHWADERIPHLLATPAAVRFLSLEPLLGPVEFSDVTRRSDALAQVGRKALTGIGWLIIGGESGPGFRPMDPAWVRDLVAQADAAGIPVFVKQASGPRPGKQGDLPDDLWARKEFPR